MKPTGIVRRIDELGRVVLPVDMRRALGLEIRDPVEVFVNENAIIIRKHQPSCIFCGSTPSEKERQWLRRLQRRLYELQ